jgi:membrane fusion protein, multidrug efflux system
MMLKKIRAFFQIMGPVVLATCFLMVPPSCSDKSAGEAKDVADSAESVLPVDVRVVGEGGQDGALILTGALEPRNQTNLTGKIGGNIQTVAVEVGARVKKGQMLASMDQSNFALGVQQAEAVHQTAKLAADVAEADFKRVQGLKDDQSISQADYEKAELGYRAAANNLRQAEIGVSMARNNLNDSVVRAPYDCQVIARMISPGSHVDPMMGTVLFVVSDTSKLRASLKLPATRAQLVRPGDKVSIKVLSADRSFDTTIDVLTDTVDPMTHTRTAVAWVENMENPIAAGLFFEARIVSGALTGKILLPASSIREEGAGKFSVYLAIGGKAERREVTGSFLPDRGGFVVSAMLNPGDNVILESSMVREGQPVQPVSSKQGS